MSGPAGSGGRPRLAAVPPPPAEPAPPRPGEPARDRSRLWLWGLAAALALAVGALAVESRRAAQLAERLAASEAQRAELAGRLERAESRLDAYDDYLAAVRSRASRLQRDLEDLTGLLAADPGEGAPAGR